MASRMEDRIDDAAIQQALGRETFLRGQAYAVAGRVNDLQVNEAHQVIVASVQGTRPQPYRTIVRLETSPALVLSGVCTCPVGDQCKHVAATLIAARRAAHPEGRLLPAGRSWEGPLSALVTAQAMETGAGGTPIALQIERVGPPKATRYAQARAAGTVPRLRIRPVVPGRTGAWVRSGISWRDLPYDVWSPRVRAHREALEELYAAYRVRGNGYGSYGSYGDQAVYLDEFGRGLWPLLRRVVDAGVALVPVKPALGPITLASDAAVVRLELREQASGVLRIDPVVALGDQALPVDDVTLLGQPAHGLSLELATYTETGEPGLLLAPLAEPLSQAVTDLLSAARTLLVPPDDRDRFLRDYYPRLRQVITVSSPDASVDLPDILPPRLLLRAAYQPGDQHAVSLEWWFQYRVGDATSLVAMGDPRPQPGLRDPSAEHALVAALELPDRELPQLRVSLAGDVRLVPSVWLVGLDAVYFTTELLPRLQSGDQADVEVVGEPPAYRRSEAAPLVHVSVTEVPGESDWFDLGVTLSIEGEDVPFQSLFSAITLGETHLILDSGTYFSIERPEYDELRRLIDEARSLQDKESDGLRVSTYQAGLWSDLAKLGVVEEQSDRWAQTVKGLLDIDQVPRPDLPVGLAATLRPYQREGYSWLAFLRAHGLGGILADDMGLGKTVQALALMAQVIEQEPAAPPFLVVAPTSVVHNWALEAGRFTPGLGVVCISETEARGSAPLAERVVGAQLVVTSYALFRIDFDAYDALAWGGLVLDEAQFVKNHQAKTYQCVRRLAAPFKLAITGTPLENNLMELWSLLSIVAPGLFPSPQRFTEFYRKPIEKGTAPELLSTLRRRIRPLMLRRTKEQVAPELPPKQEQVLEVTLHPRHHTIYQTHLQRERQKVLGLLDDVDKNRFAIFRSLTLLRQLSLAAGLIDEKYADVRSSKIDAFLEHIAEVVREGHRALVFSQFTGFLRLVRERLDADDIDSCYLDGRTRDRAAQIAGFKAGLAPVFLISLKAGGFGLNLTEADYVFVLDPWWNPAVEAQAVDRTHRIGQDKTVMVYRLVAMGTIEEKVMELKARKQELFDQVMDEDALLAAPLTADDVRGLFGL